MADGSSPNPHNSNNIQQYADMGNPFEDTGEETTTITETYTTSLICDGNNAIFIAHDQDGQPLTFDPQSQPPVDNNPALEFDIYDEEDEEMSMGMDMETDDEYSSDSDGGAPLFQVSDTGSLSSQPDEDEAMLDGDGDDEDSNYDPEIMSPAPAINPPNQDGAPLHNHLDDGDGDGGSTTMMASAQADDEVGDDTISTISSFISDIDEALLDAPPPPPPPPPQPSN